MKSITEAVAGLTQKFRYDPSKDTLDELIQAAQITTDKYEPVDEAEMKAIELRSLGFETLASQLESKISKRKKLNKITELKYIAITEKDICDFLDRRVKRYDDGLLKTSSETTLNTLGMMQWTQNKSLEKMLLRGDARTYLPYIQSPQWLDASSGYNIYPPSLTTTGGTIQDPFPIALGIDMPVMPERNKRIPVYSSRGVKTIARATKDWNKTSGIGKFVYEEIPIDVYAGVPPADVLESLKEHQANKCFDYFAIGLVKQIKDPILWGRIDDDERRWFIRQWGKDISLDDLLR